MIFCSEIHSYFESNVQETTQNSRGHEPRGQAFRVRSVPAFRARPVVYRLFHRNSVWRALGTFWLITYPTDVLEHYGRASTTPTDLLIRLSSRTFSKKNYMPMALYIKPVQNPF